MENVTKDKMGQFVFRMLDSQKQILFKIADRDDRSVSATIRRAIGEYIKRDSEVLSNDGTTVHRLSEGMQ